MIQTSRLMSVLGIALTISGAAPQCLAQRSPIQFDMPSVAVAQEVALASIEDVDAVPAGWMAIDYELRLSCINESPAQLAMQQCTVRVKPRDAAIQFVDYSPRTEIVSDVAGPIQIKRTDEKSRSLGVSLDGNYGNLARGNVGGDNGSKQIECLQYDRAAPLQAVITSGTYDRGRGVYFKFRRTETQVLEGERRFQLTMCVPPTWRAELVDVNVWCETESRKRSLWDKDADSQLATSFVVATYRNGDAEAADLAHRLATAEYELRVMAQRIARPVPKLTLTSMWRQVGKTFDPRGAEYDARWLSNLLQTGRDPQRDRNFSRLPARVRSTASGYANLRQQFINLNGRPHGVARSQTPSLSQQIRPEQIEQR